MPGPVDIERHAIPGAIVKELIIDERDQRRALAPGRDVSRAEIGDHRDTRAFRNHRSLSDLQSIAAALVIDRLAVAADETNAVQWNLRTLASLEDGIRVQLAEPETETRDGGGGRRCIGHIQNRAPHCGRVGCGPGCQGVDAPAFDVDDGDVHPIDRGAAHDAGYTHERFSSSCSSLNSCSASMGRSSSSFNARMRSAMLWFTGANNCTWTGPVGFNSPVTTSSVFS